MTERSLSSLVWEEVYGLTTTPSIYWCVRALTKAENTVESLYERFVTAEPAAKFLASATQDYRPGGSGNRPDGQAADFS